MGIVRYSIEYIVDLDNKDQVDVAKDFICSDVEDTVRFNTVTDCIDFIEDPMIPEGAVSQSILECCTDCNDEDEDSGE